MKKIFSVLLLGTALTFSTACKKDEKKDDDKGAKPADDKGAKPADDKGAKPADDKGAAPAMESTGSAECDELMKRTLCQMDKAGAAVPPESRKAFEDSAKAWRDAIKVEASKQAVIDGCKMSLDAGKDGWAALGC